MTRVEGWPQAPPLETERLSLEPLRVEHADELVAVLAGVSAGADGVLLGRLAWIVGVEHQGRGYAREAAATVAAWMRSAGDARLIADIHPEHGASMAIACALGLRQTGEAVDGGELRWQA